MRVDRKSLWAAALAVVGVGCGGTVQLDSEALLGAATEPIINGVLASSYPEAALVDMNGAACSGALIAPRVVLTAGHCVTGMRTWKVTLPFARNQSAKATGATVYDYTDTSEYVNPDQHDIGLIFLGTSLTLDRWPVIPQAPLADGATAIDIGRIQSGTLSNSALFQSHAIPLKNARSEGFPYDYYSTEVIEAGDSGGPVVDAASSPHAIVAVNSGGGNGTEVLARTDLLYAWIDQQVKAHGGWGTDAGGASSGGTSSGGSSSGGTTLDGAALYASKCAGCHGALASSDVRGTSAAQILGRHGSTVTSAQATAISGALAGGSSSGGTSSGGTSSSSGGTSSGGSACAGEVEPNNGYRTPNSLGTAACGTLTTGDVVDWYTWSIAGSTPYAVNLRATGDARLYMWKRVNGVYYRVANTTDTSIEHTATGAGTYVVLVVSFGASPQSYQLTRSGGASDSPSSSGGTSSGGGSSSGGASSSGGSSSGGSSSGGTPIDGKAVYTSKCARCHGALGASDVRGATASQILARHGGMVSSAEAAAIADAL